MTEAIVRKVFEDLIQTIERNAVNNVATISNVKLWAQGWRDELLNAEGGLSIGKKARVTNLFNGHGFAKEEIVTIIAVDRPMSTIPFLCSNKNGKYWMAADELALIEE